METNIHSLTELMQALAANNPQILRVQTSIVCPHSILLPPGYELVGNGSSGAVLSFSNGDGICLTGYNTIRDLIVISSPSCRAIYLAAGIADMGTIRLNNLSVIGQVSLIARTGTLKVQIDARQVDVVAADARHFNEQPQKYGVNVLQGAFTVYNFNNDPKSLITASLDHIAAGRPGAPVLGSGVFVSGYSESGGAVRLDRLLTEAVYSHGMLAEGTADIITGGVFINYGVRATEVVNTREVTTYGVNDMVLDNWGTVENWTANERIVSYGPSGIGFVNFGTVNQFIAKGDITTYGAGARGFNQYDGALASITLASITTHGHGSIGIQVSKPIGEVRIKGSIVTHGSVGNSLLKGVLTRLPATAFSVKPGGEVSLLSVQGNIESYGDDVDTLTVEGGKISAIDIGGEVVAHGQRSAPIYVGDGGIMPQTNVKAWMAQ
ncbi:MAG TPA: hypothetical protein VNV35_02350 [Puia sp.]|jgi:hypothetical protein|nr:hypothetical protein [Puia sp.]